MASHWSRLPRAVVEALFLEVFKNHDVVLRTGVTGVSGSAGLMFGLEGLKGLFQP